VFGLVANDTELGLHLFLDREAHLALGVVELALLSDQVGLGLLGFGQLGVALPKHLVEVGDFFDLLVDVDGDQALRLPGLGRRDATALFIDLGGHCGVDGIPGCGDLRLLITNGRFPTGDLSFFSGELVLVPPAGVLDERRRQRFRQLDLGSASWTGECWFGLVSASESWRESTDGTGYAGRRIRAVENVPQVTDGPGGSAGGHASALLLQGSRRSPQRRLACSSSDPAAL
jgi:hypothetical protein